MTFPLLLAVCLLMPWYVIRGSIGPIPVTLLEVSIVALVVIWMLEHRLGGQEIRWPDRTWLILMGLFGLTSSLSILIAPDIRAALGIYKAYIIEPMAVFIIAVDQIQTASRARGVLIATLAAGASVGILTVTQTVFGWPNVAPAELLQGRASAMYNSANAVGLFLGPIIVVLSAASGWLLYRRRYLWGILAATTAAALLVCVALTKSDGALAGLLVACVVMGGAVITRRLRIPFVVTLGLLVLSVTLYVFGTVGFIWFYNQPPEVLNPYARPNFTTMTIRQCVWQGTVGALNASPILGLGLGSFAVNYLPHATCDAEPLTYPHNLILNFWVETGLLGLLSMLGLITLLLFWSTKLLYASDLWVAAGVAGYGVVSYWLVHGLVDVPYFKNDLSAAWWLVLAGCQIAVNLMLQQQKTSRA
jgi:O-antigen ligase